MLVCYIPGRRQRGDEKKSKAQQTPKLPPIPQVNWDMRLCPKSDFPAQAPATDVWISIQFLAHAIPIIWKNWRQLNLFISYKLHKSSLKLEEEKRTENKFCQTHLELYHIWLLFHRQHLDPNQSQFQGMVPLILELKTISSSSLLPPPFNSSGGNPRG